eukprot:1805403-Prymnesium_polylepis.1
MTVRAAVTLSTMSGAAMASPSPTRRWLTILWSWETMVMQRRLHVRFMHSNVRTSASSPSPSLQRCRLSLTPLTPTVLLHV